MNLKINKLRTLEKLLESNASHAMLFFVTGFTKIYLYRFYIPELIRLANDVQTTQVQELLIHLKLLPHHTVKVMLKYFGTANVDTQCVNVSVGTCLKFQEANNLFS